MYAVVTTGGKQYRVEAGSTLVVEKLAGEPGDAGALSAVLVVDGDSLVSDAKQLAKVSVAGELVEHTKGPKIEILRYRNTTGYKRRPGHRQPLTTLRVTGIEKKA